LVLNEELAGESRAHALAALGALNDPALANLVEAALDDVAPKVRTVARDVLVTLDPVRAVNALEQAISSDDVIERQGALATLGPMKSKDSAQVIFDALAKMNAGQIPLDTQLDLLAAARLQTDRRIKEKIAEHERTLPKDDPLAPYRITLAGGNVENGAELFFERRELSCVRCHKIDDQGGEVGPDLSVIGKDKKPDYLLESIVLPNKSIAKGFESVAVITDDGLVRTGIVRHEDDNVLRIMTATGEEIEIDQDTIEARRASESSMPNDLPKHLTLFEMRDLIEFLSNRKVKKAGDGHR
jgi:quinoprotein glucose dehydrogenase